jgi:hypothetical protein
VGERPGKEEVDRGPVGVAIGTSLRGNSPAFGFSITVTGSFAMLQTLAGSPTVVQILLFGVSAALTIGIVEGLVTRGFRDPLGVAPAEVRMLGTAQNFVSVAAGLAAAAGVGALLDAGGAWPLGACAATSAFLVAESAETLLAEWVQRRRGDPEAERAEDE